MSQTIDATTPVDKAGGLDIMPVLLGTDMNCYSTARAFHEEYGVKSHAFGRYKMGETKFSRIVKVKTYPNMNRDDVMLRVLARFAQQYPLQQKVLLGCTDEYAEMIMRNCEELGKNYIVPSVGGELLERLTSKEFFYQYCDHFEIPYPETVIFRKETGEEVLTSLPFEYPIIIKPSSSIEYWQHPFDGMKKVYVAENSGQAQKIIKTIYEAGYEDSLVLQDFIPGADSGMRVLTAYCDRNAKVKMMCLGHVLLEEHTPKAIGNHAAIITEYNRLLMEKIKIFLESIGYTGYANFDIKLDPRDGSYRVFEINLRLGRSNYYVTGAGLNVAKYIVDDRLLLKNLGRAMYFQGGTYWHSIPNEIVWQYTDGPELVAQAKELVKEKKESTSLGYAFDLEKNPLRNFYIKEHNRRYFQKYEQYCPKPKKNKQV